MSVQLPPLPVLKETAGVISAPFTLDGGPSALDEPILLSSPEGNEVLENEDNVPNDNAESSEDEIEEESLLDKEKKRLEEEGRNAVLGLRPTETLEEKYEKLKLQCQETIRNLGEESQVKIETLLSKFKRTWKSLENDNQDILECLTVPENLCVMSRSEMKELRHLAHQTTSERDAYLRRLEKELETVDVERATRLNGIMADYGLQVRKLRFLPSETAMRLLQDECVNANLCMLENRESIVQYISVLRAMNIEMNRMIENCFEGYGKTWHQIRYDHLFENYDKEIKAIMSQDIQVLFQEQKKELDLQLQKQVEHIKSICDIPTAKLTAHTFKDWKVKAFSELRNQEDAARDFQQQIHAFQARLENEATACICKWAPLLAECEVEVTRDGVLNDVLQVQVDKYRQDTAYTDGKRAAMLMPLQCTRNDEIVERICQFMDCVFALKSETKENIAKIETDRWDSIRNSKEANRSNLMRKEKLYEKDMHNLLEERNPDSCLARKQDLLASLAAIDDVRLDFYNQSIELTNSMADLVSKESEAYYSSLCQFFDITETPTQEDLDSGKLTSFTLKNRTLYVLPPLNESAFLQEKIKFWFEYKIQQQKERESDVQQAVNIERKKKKKDPNRVTYARIIRAKTPLTTPAVVRPALKTPESRQEPKVSIEGLANLVVQVPQIPNSKLTNLRYFLQKALLEEAEEWHVKLVQEYTQKMDAHVVKLSEERAMTIRQQELRMDELEKAWVDHLANLQKMDVAHENEAQVLAHKLKLLKDEYSQAMSGLKDESIKFLTSVIPKYSEKLENAKSSIELSKLAQKFKNSSSAHKETLQKQLFAADKKFEDGRKGLMRSQAPYQHGDAWDILSCRGYHCEIDILALDDHKDSFKDRIETIQLETSESVNRMGAELNLFFDDSVFLDKIDRILKTLKVTLRGKLAVFSQERVTLMDKISSLSQFSKKKGFNWGSIQEMLKVMESIRVDLVHQTLSLNCLKKGITVADFDNCFLLSYDQWLSQKQELRELEDMKIKAHKSKISGVKKISYGPAGGTPRANSAEKLDKAAPLTSLKEGFTASRAGSVKSLHGSNGNLATVKSGDAEVADRNSLAGTTKSRRSEAKEAAYKISKVYFDSKPPKYIRRTQEIPLDLESFMLKVEARLVKIEEFVDEKRDIHLLELRQIVTLIDKEVRSAFDTIFSHVLTQTMSSVSDQWTQKTSRFIQLYSSTQMEKESLLGQLKHRLGHPSATKELKDLDSQAQKTVAELHEYMSQMNDGLRHGLGSISKHVLDQVEFLTVTLSGLLDGLVMIQHVDVPPLRPSPIKTQRTVAQLLRDQQDQSLKAQAETASAAKELGAEGHVIREGLEGTLIPLPHVSDFTGFSLLTKASPTHDHLFTHRQSLFSSYCKELTRRLSLLEEHISTEDRYQSEWLETWQSQILKVKRVFA